MFLTVYACIHFLIKIYLDPFVTCVYIYTYICVCVFIYIYIYISHTYIYIYDTKHIRIYTYNTYIYIHVYNSYIHIYIHIYMCVWVYKTFIYMATSIFKSSIGPRPTPMRPFSVSVKLPALGSVPQRHRRPAVPWWFPK